MAGLGAGAGAFEGDTERNRLAEQRRQANMQANIQRKRLNLAEEEAEKDDEFRREATQFNQQKQVAEFRAGREQDAWNRRRQEKLDADAAEQKKWDRGKDMWGKRRTEALDVRDREKQDFEQGRAAKQDEWSEALHGLALEKHEQEMAERNATLGLYRERAKYESDMLANKQKMAKSHYAGLVMSAKESPNGVSPQAALDLYNESTGSQFVSFTMLPDGSAVVASKGQDGKIVEEYSQRDIINSVVAYATGEDLKTIQSGTREMKQPMDVDARNAERDRAAAAAKEYGRLLDAAIKAIPEMKDDPQYEAAVDRANALSVKHQKLLDAAYGDLLPKAENPDPIKGARPSGGRVTWRPSNK